MTVILDGQGNTLVRNIYKSGILVRQVYGNGNIYEYRYSLSSKKTYFDKVTITFPDHHEQEIEVGDSVSEYLRAKQDVAESQASNSLNTSRRPQYLRK